MAISSAICTSAKMGWLSGGYNIADNYYMALYTSSATLDSTTTAYTASNEVANGNGYITGGVLLTGISLSTNGTAALLSWANASWAAATITAAGALIYDSSKANAAICTISFGGNISSTSGTFSVNFPAYAPGTVFIQL